MTRAYGYIRTNQPNQQARIDRQRAAIERTAEALGVEVAQFYLDEAVPGHNNVHDRPGMQGLLAQVREGDMIIVAAADRIARSAEGLLSFMDWADEAGVALKWADLAGYDRPVHAFNMKDAKGLMHHVQVFMNMSKCGDIVKAALSMGEGQVEVGDLISLKIRPTGMG